MHSDQENIVIRQATMDDAWQIAEILVEDWKDAYRGIIEDAYLDSMSVEARYQRELKRYQVYTVAEANQEILGFAWNDMTEHDAYDCEIIALYVRWENRISGIGRALFQNSMERFRAAGKKRMIVWCLRENAEARKFYEKMGGQAYKTGTHPWGNREYAMISYLYPLDELP